MHKAWSLVTNSLHCNTIALVGILKTSSKVDIKSATEIGKAMSEVKDSQVANNVAQMDTKDTPTLSNQSVVNGETATADATSAVLLGDNVQQDSQYKSSFIADVMISTEVKSKVDSTLQNVSSDGKIGHHPSDEKYSSVTINQLETEQVPPITVDQAPLVSVNPVLVDQVPTVTVDQVPPVTIDQKPPVTVDQAPPATTDQKPPIIVNQAPTVTVDPITDQKPPTTVDQVSPNQFQGTNSHMPPMTVDQVSNDKPNRLPAEQVSTVTVDHGPPIVVDRVLQTTVDLPPVNIDQGPQVTVVHVPSTNQVPLASGDQPSQIKTIADHVKGTVDQVPVNPLMDSQEPPCTNQDVVDQKSPVDQTSQPAVSQIFPVVVPSVPTDQVLPITVDQGPSVATDQIPSNQKPPDQELNIAVKAAVQTKPTAPSTNHQDLKQAQPPAAKSAQSKSGKTKKKSGSEGITGLHTQATYILIKIIHCCHFFLQMLHHLKHR